MKRLTPVLLGLLCAAEAHAFILPYSTRTRDFSSWTPATQGDTKTIGMAGATVALPTSISSAEANPAGYAMTTESVSAQINNTTFNDQRLQRSGDSITNSQAGFAISPEHWGFAISLNSPQTESGTYVSPNTGDTVKAEVAIKELRLIAARAFFNNDLSLGAGLELAKATRALNDESSDSFAVSFQLGALYHLPNHVLFGASFSPELDVGPSGQAHFESVMPGFNRAVIRPALLTFGAGWIPNRYFSLGLSLTFVQKTKNTALLYDQEVITGNAASWVPRIGASYVIATYPNVKIEAAAGLYYESSRLSNQADRTHLTAGLEINPSFINLGAGFDVSTGFQNFIISAGIDLVRTARFFNIIPAEAPPSYKGFFPRITRLSSEGLPAGLTAGEPNRPENGGVTEVTNIVVDVPANVAKKVTGQKTSVEMKEAARKKEKGKAEDK